MSDRTKTISTDADARARAVYERLCRDPDVWLTHGLPIYEKAERIVAAIAEELDQPGSTADRLAEEEEERAVLARLKARYGS